jgi:gliding motility-associated-like protein
MNSLVVPRFYVLACFLLMLAAAAPTFPLQGQCISPISAFPYQEDFESGTGGWVSGGTLDDWAWGTPAKAIINTAGSGTRCWITGGLSASFYNLGEKSWVQSPCFDFTSLDYPYLSFRVYWETEKQYDGASLQVSTNGGASWTTVGTAADPTDCLNQNWYNAASVNNLSGLSGTTAGWSGTTLPTSGSCQGGSGSGGWVTAKHCLFSLAGLPSVTFRFVFGAGTTCNAFDGFAFDLFRIEETPGIIPNYTYTCNGSRSVSFQGSANVCATGWSWNFGDPASGSNTSVQQNPTHVFSHDTTFTVTIRAQTPCGNAATSVNEITFPHTTFVVTPVSCAGDSDGAVVALVDNWGSPAFLWNVQPPASGPNLDDLKAGTYGVTVSGAGICSSDYTVTLTDPPAIGAQTALVAAGCGPASGKALVQPSGGTPPYTYAWLPYGGSEATADSLDPGVFMVWVTDSAGCSAKAIVDIPEDCVNDILFPSAFTPNGDGRNDVFAPSFVRIASYSIRIFNRWGGTVFSSDDILQPWDGTVGGRPAEGGVYVYFASYSVDGAETREKRGIVTLYH